MSVGLTSAGAVQWAEGSWTAVVTPRGVMMLPPTIDDDVVTGFWEVMRSGGASMIDILDELVLGTGGRLDSVPEFVILLTEEGGDAHLVVRGRPEVVVDNRPVDSREVATWFETHLPAPRSVVVSAPEEAGKRMRPVADAIVAAAALSLGQPLEEEPQAPVEDLAEAPEPLPVVEEASLPEAPAPLAEAEVVAAPAFVEVEPATEDVVTGPAPAEEAVEEAPAPVVAEPAEEPAAVEDSGAEAVEEAEEPVTAEAAEEPVAGSVEEAPALVLAEEEPALVLADPVEAPVDVEDVADEDLVTEAVAAPAPLPAVTTPPSGTIEEDLPAELLAELSLEGSGDSAQSAPSAPSVPSADSGVLPAVEEPVLEEPAALDAPEEASPAGSAASASAPSADEDYADDVEDDEDEDRYVLATPCASGHANPTNYTRCRECGEELTLPAQRMVCPPLGTMTTSAGEFIELDHSAVVGRHPDTSVFDAGTGPVYLVSVPSPDRLVSRNHVRITLEEWAVLVEDLSTRNGTVLCREDEAPVRIASASPVLLRSGDVLVLGDGQSLAFEDLP